MRCRLIIASMLLACAAPAWAQSSVTMANPSQDTVLETYHAYIGRDDLYNSNGQRLTEAWQILRQDRANYYKGIRQRGDEGDDFFASADNRARMEEMLRGGLITGPAAQAIVQGDVMVTVRIIGHDRIGDSIRVTVD